MKNGCPDNKSNARPLPRCMRITESPVDLSSGALAMLVSHLQGRSDATGGSELESFALHTWRLGRRIDGMADDEGNIKRQLQDSHRRLTDALAELGVTVEDPVGRAYTDGWLEVNVIAWEEPTGPAPDGITGPWVKQTIRPVIRRGDVLLCKGEIVVADPSNVDSTEHLNEEN